MVRIKGNISLTIVFFICISLSSFGNNDGKEKTHQKDTVTALVIAPSNPLYNSISGLSGKSIISMIDSLLELDQIPSDLLKELNDYAESRLLEHDYYISLTNYYDNSEFPASSIYGKWDTQNISSFNETSVINDSAVLLTLTDSKNNCNFVAPIQNPKVTSHFGWRDGKNHNGIDLDLHVWDPVVASFDGMVRIALFHPGYGRVVVIRHYNGLETLYAHLHRFKVKAGEIVEAGQIIGLGGSSGHSSGSHLHYEVRYKGKSLNPRHIISFNKNKLISDKLELIKNKWDYAALPIGIKHHMIEKGDFMYKIANRYGLTVNELCELNGIKRNKILIVGRKIRIK